VDPRAPVTRPNVPDVRELRLDLVVAGIQRRHAVDAEIVGDRGAGNARVAIRHRDDNAGKHGMRNVCNGALQRAELLLRGRSDGECERP